MDDRIIAYWKSLPGSNWTRELDIRQGGSHFVCLRCGDDGKEMQFDNMDVHCNSERHKDPEAFLKGSIARYNLEGELKKRENGQYTFKCAKCSATLKFSVRTCASSLNGHSKSMKHTGNTETTTKRAIATDLKKEGQKKIKTDDNL